MTWDKDQTKHQQLQGNRLFGREKHMKYIIVDLEMNPIDKKYNMEREISRMEVIEIGAVALDEAYQEIGSFKTLVKPEYNDVIERRYERLTGISTKMVQEAPVFTQALHMFFSWCGSMGDEVEIFQWSDNDYRQIRKEMDLKHVALSPEEQKLFQSWKDFQEEYGKKLGVSSHLSLKNAIMYAGVDAEGTYHDALFDARNTAALFRTVRDPEACWKALGKVIRALKPEKKGTTLGDLFDFGSLEISA